ncbi:MAG: penicillin-binding protein 2 [Burkholderiales bacterium]|nr:penicillin-binding protein 2 [Burkholderiales bacterium]
MSYRPKALALQLPGWRSHLLLALIILSFAGMLTRAVYLQGIRNDFLRQKGESRYSRVIELSAHRGMIADRNGEPLAISTPVESVWASPGDVEIDSGQLKELAEILNLAPGEIKKRLGEEGRDFVYLERQLPPEQAARIVELKIPGIFLQREYRRYYPSGEVMAQILGFTNSDDNGQEGLELAYQNILAGKPGSRRVIKDRLGRIVEDVESIRTPKPGQDIVLSIDSKIQYLAYREIKHAVEENKARAGAVVVLDSKTGEVLAMANVPTYNPNNREDLKVSLIRNRVVTDSFEPGSTLKPFTIAAALETGKYTPDTVIDTSPGTLSIGSATIHDAHREGLLSVSQIIQKSSNVGASKIALSLAPETMWDMLHNSGFGSDPGSGFPGEASGRLRPYAGWHPIEQATMSFGNGISVSLLQLARGYTIFTNGGMSIPVTFLKRDTLPQGRQVISVKTAHEMTRILETVVQPEGTGPLAQVMGYRVGGKTGTAHKVEGNGYSARKYIASFIGFAPASNPRLIVAVMVDEPSNGKYYGGEISAPVFSRVMAGALRTLGVPFDAQANNIVLPQGDGMLKGDM